MNAFEVTSAFFCVACEAKFYSERRTQGFVIIGC
jgi:hypothetical protein